MLFLLQVRDFRGAPSYFYDERPRYSEQPEMRRPDISDVLADFRRDATYRFDDSLGFAAYRSEKLPFRALFEAYQTPTQ